MNRKVIYTEETITGMTLNDFIKVHDNYHRQHGNPKNATDYVPGEEKLTRPGQKTAQKEPKSQNPKPSNN
ncbi:hypothetical protein TKK_0000728 [Trichogramma kaykai]